eukprot:g2787.t1
MPSDFPISELNPYHKTWTICARVLSKSQVRSWNKLGGKNTGQVFSVDLVDAEGGEIRASFFNEAASKFGEILESGKVYKFAKGTVRVANKSYNQCNHEYELQFNANAEVTASEDDGAIAQQLAYQFTDLRALRTRALPCTIDVIGVVSKVEDTREWQKDGVRYSKYAFTVVDETETELEVSIFGATAQKYPRASLLGADGNAESSGKVVALKGVVVKQFQGRSGVLQDSGTLVLDPKGGATADRAAKLSAWWKAGGSSKSFVSMREAGTGPTGTKIKEVSLATLVDQIEPSSGMNKEEFIITETYARMSRILTERKGEPIVQWYDACTEIVKRENTPAGVSGEQRCNKKLQDGYCSVHGHVKGEKRWLIRAVFEDATGDQIFGLFDDDMKKITKKSAQEASEMQVSIDTWYKNFYNTNLFKLRLRSYKEEYQGRFIGKSRVLAIDPVNPTAHIEKRMQMINEMWGN